MRLSIVFGTRGTPQALLHLERIFHDLSQQTFQNFQVMVVVDRKFEDKEDFWRFYQKISEDFTVVEDISEFVKEKVQFFTNLNSDFVPQSKWGASAVRNFGLQQVDTELVQLFDDDNGFDPEYLEKAIQYYDEYKARYREVVICATIQHRDSGIVRNQGFSHFRYWESRSVRFFTDGKTKAGAEIQMFSGNGLLGSTQLFQSVGYDEEIAWIAEDMDFTLSLYEKGAKLFVFPDLLVRHYEREKTVLEGVRIGSQAQAHQKAKNWFLFVRKHGSFWNKVQFRCLGLPGCLVWLSLKALLYGGKSRRKIIHGLFQGVREGCKQVL